MSEIRREVPESFLLVTGSMRSGTTLLGELLHPRAGHRRHPDLVFDNDRISLIRELAQRHRDEEKTNEWLVEDPFRLFIPSRSAIHALLYKEQESESDNSALGD